MAVRVQTAPFDLAQEVAAVTAGRCDVGAVVTFTGTMRGTTAAGRELICMELEHYPGMTEAELARVEAEAQARWPLQATVVVHRVGRLVPGEDIVLVVAASAHRQAAFEAAMFLMDHLKTRATFWKKEVGRDGTGHWVDARESDAAAADGWSRGVPDDQPKVDGVGVGRREGVVV